MLTRELVNLILKLLHKCVTIYSKPFEKQEYATAWDWYNYAKLTSSLLELRYVPEFYFDGVDKVFLNVKVESIDDFKALINQIGVALLSRTEVCANDYLL